VLDAIWVKDGVKVVLKRVPSDGDEVRIALYLSSFEMRSNPRNRTVPILDVIVPPDDKYVLLVMPFLRVFSSPPFHCRWEVVEALRQFLQVVCLNIACENDMLIIDV
jgi:hypothetical protein